MTSPRATILDEPLVRLAPLYVAQGLPFGLFTQALPVLLRQRGASLEIVGASALLALPWALKPLLAPLVDRHGSRRAWIVPLQSASAALLLALSFVAPTSIVPIVIATFISNALAASQDIATDAMAVESLPLAQRGLGNGVQVAAYRVGMMIGGGALLFAVDHIGWASALRVASALSVLVLVPLFVGRTEARARPSILVGQPTNQVPLTSGAPSHSGRAHPALEQHVSPAPSRPGASGTASAPRKARSADEVLGLSSLLDAARSLGMPWILLLVIYKLGDGLATTMLRPALVDQGHTLGSIGALLGGLGFGAGLVGALVGGASVRAIGHARALVLFAVAQAAGIASYVLIDGRDPSGPIVLEHFTSGMATAALFTCMMGLCRPGHAAVDYTLQSGLVVVAAGLGAALGGPLAHGLGYDACFGIGAVSSLAAAAMAATLAGRLRAQES